jgi:Zn-dependent protease
MAKRLRVHVEDIVVMPVLLMVRLRLPEDARTELAVASAGPATNLALGGLFLAVAPALGVPRESLLVPWGENAIGLVFWVNLLMGIVNLVPAFPMDGGRILRAVLALRLDYVTATRWAVRVGWGVLLVACVVGVVRSGYWGLPVLAAFLVVLGRREEQGVRQRAHAREVLRLKRELTNAGLGPGESAAWTAFGDFRRLRDPAFRARFERYREEIEELRVTRP